MGRGQAGLAQRVHRLVRGVPAGLCATAPLPAGAPTSGTAASGVATGDLAGRVAPEACKPSLLGEGGDAIGSIYAVVDGELAGRCFGQRNDALIDAWTTLAAVTPREQRRLVVALAGVKADSDSLAFTTPVDDAQSRFAIAVNTNEAKKNPQELRLTIVHELAHVLTLAPGQLTQDTSASAGHRPRNGGDSWSRSKPW